MFLSSILFFSMPIFITLLLLWLFTHILLLFVKMLIYYYIIDTQQYEFEC